MPEKPLSADELFALGRTLTLDIHAAVERGRAYYLGFGRREPPVLLSAVFNPESGTVIPYFVKVIRALNRPQASLTFRKSAALKETWRKSILHLLLKNPINEGFGLYVANRLLNDIAKAFEVRERQLRGEPNLPSHEFFVHEFDTIKSMLSATGKSIVKAINTRNIDGLDITGPRTEECKEQVMAVARWLANPRHPQNIHHACERTFVETPNGYEDAERLYRWCFRNRCRVWAWVETYRLNHDLE